MQAHRKRFMLSPASWTQSYLVSQICRTSFELSNFTRFVMGALRRVLRASGWRHRVEIARLERSAVGPPKEAAY